MAPSNKGPQNPAAPRHSTLLWRTRGLLALIVAVGLALRLWGIGWSLPDPRHPLATYHPDELVNLNAAMQADIPHGKFDIGFYNYGAFYFYLVSFAQTFGRGYHLIPAPVAWPVEKPPIADTEKLALEAPEQAGLFLAGRLVTVLLGVATIPVVFALGRRLYSEPIGLLAALLSALAPLGVVHSHFLTVDVPATFFVALALLWAARLLAAVHGKEQGTERSKAMGKELIVAGVWCGLAAATKYTAGLVLVAPLTALCLAGRTSVHRDAEAQQGDPPRTDDVEPTPLPPVANALENPNTASSETAQPAQEPAATPTATGNLPAPFSWANRIQGALALVAVTILVFLIACPGPWLNWNAFWNGLYPGSGVRYELFEHARTGHGYLFVNTGPGWWYHLTVSLPMGLGLPLMLLAVAGVLNGLLRREPGDWILLTFVLLSYAAVSFSAVRFGRYLIPLFPPLCILAARLVLGRFTTRIGLRVGLAVGALVVLFTAVYCGALVRVMALPDARDLAAAYLEQNTPRGASIAFAHIPWFFSPPLSPLWGAPRSDVRARAALDTTRFHFRIPVQEWDPGVLDPPPDVVVLSNFETMHEVDRLHMERPTAFVNAIERQYRPTVFAHAPVYGLPANTPVLPEDLLYILPVITVYQKR